MHFLVNCFFSAILALCLFPLQGYAQNPIADMILTNGTIYTASPKQLFAESVAVGNGKIMFLGSEQAVMPYIGESTQVIDLKGMLLLPGFIDNHNHVFEAASEAAGNCELSSTAVLSEQISYLEQCRRDSKSKCTVMGF